MLRRIIYIIIVILLLILLVLFLWWLFNRNQPPEAVADSFETTQNTAVSGNLILNDTDPEGEPLDIELSPVTQPLSGTVILVANGDFTYTPATDVTGTDSFEYRVCDPSDACSEAEVTITILDGAPPPPPGVTAVDDAYTTTPNTAVVNNVLTNDTPTGALTVTLPPSTLPTNGTVDLQADGSFTYAPSTDFEGTDSFTYEACDVSAVCDTAIVTIEVTSTPPPPPPGVVDAVDDTFSAGVNAPATGNVLNNDTPTGALTATKTSDPTSGTVELLTTGDMTYTPSTDFSGADSFTYEACDGDGSCDSATVTLNIGGVSNGEPDAQDDAYEVVENQTLTGNVTDNDTDPHDLALTVTTPVADDVDNGSLTLNSDGSFSYTPDSDYTGADSFQYEVCNSDNKCATATAAITVKADDGSGGQPSTLHHTVERGEWLIQIARCYGTSVHAIRRANNIPNPNRIFAGRKLIIPGVGSQGEQTGPPCIDTYTVQEGDTPATIAAQFGIKESELLRVNGIPHRKRFYVGQYIVIPKPVPDYMKP